MIHVYKCNVCRAEFDTEEDCLAHEQMHRDEPRFEAVTVYLYYDTDSRKFEFLVAKPFTTNDSPGEQGAITRLTWKVNALNKPEIIARAKAILKNVADTTVKQIDRAMEELESK